MTRKKDNNLKSEISVVEIGNKFANLLLPPKLNLFFKVRYFSFICYFAAKISIKFKNQDNIFWVRDIILALFLSLFSKSNVLCEIHRYPKGIQLYILRLLLRRKNVIVTSITKILADKVTSLSKKNKSIVILPMAVPKEELKLLNENKIVRENKIVYLGHSRSGDSRIDYNILNEAAKIVFIEFPNWRMQIIGIDSKEFQSNISSPLSENIELIGIIPREETINFVSTATIGIVVYPNSPWFIDSFPVKIVEYAASGLAIVASDTPAHRNLLDDSKCIFYNVNSYNDLGFSINLLISQPNKIKYLSSNAKSWATSFTYERRVLQAISNFRKTHIID